MKEREGGGAGSDPLNLPLGSTAALGRLWGLSSRL